MRRSSGDGPFRPRSWWAPAFVALVAIACSSSSKDSSVNDCSRVGKCGPDDQLTDPMVVACTNDLADKTCGALYQTVLDCNASEEVCLTGGVGRDDTATFNNCLTQLNAWNACQAPPVDAGPGVDVVSNTAGDVEAGEGPDEGVDAAAGTDAATGADANIGVDAEADAPEAAAMTPDAGIEAGAEAGADTGVTPQAGAAEAGSEAGADASPEAAADAGADARRPLDARAD